MAYAYGPHIFAHDRRVLDIPLEDRLQSRTSDLIAWAKAMLTAIHKSIRDAQAQLYTSHHDIRIYFFDTTAAEPPTTTTPTATTAPTTSTARLHSHLLAIRQRFQHFDRAN
jgi:hypothetical protein